MTLTKEELIQQHEQLLKESKVIIKDLENLYKKRDVLQKKLNELLPQLLFPFADLKLHEECKKLEFEIQELSRMIIDKESELKLLQQRNS